MKIQDIAKICHQANKAYCEALGDNSQPEWENAPNWATTSAINGVKFHLANPNAKPSQSHEEWFKEKQATGWKYGPVKNPETKEHPCFVPYDQLPNAQQLKDKLFIAVVSTFRQEIASS